MWSQALVQVVFKSLARTKIVFNSILTEQLWWHIQTDKLPADGE